MNNRNNFYNIEQIGEQVFQHPQTQLTESYISNSSFLQTEAYAQNAENKFLDIEQGKSKESIQDYSMVSPPKDMSEISMTYSNTNQTKSNINSQRGKIPKSYIFSQQDSPQYEKANLITNLSSEMIGDDLFSTSRNKPKSERMNTERENRMLEDQLLLMHQKTQKFVKDVVRNFTEVEAQNEDNYQEYFFKLKELALNQIEYFYNEHQNTIHQQQQIQSQAISIIKSLDAKLNTAIQQRNYFAQQIETLTLNQKSEDEIIRFQEQELYISELQQDKAQSSQEIRDLKQQFSQVRSQLNSENEEMRVQVENMRTQYQSLQISSAKDVVEMDVEIILLKTQLKTREQTYRHTLDQLTQNFQVQSLDKENQFTQLLAQYDEEQSSMAQKISQYEQKIQKLNNSLMLERSQQAASSSSSNNLNNSISSTGFLLNNNTSSSNNTSTSTTPYHYHHVNSQSQDLTLYSSSSLLNSSSIANQSNINTSLLNSSSIVNQSVTHGGNVVIPQNHNMSHLSTTVNGGGALSVVNSDRESQLATLQKKLRSQNRLKEEVQRTIRKWIQQFKEREGREPTLQDKQPIRSHLGDYKQYEQNISELNSKIEALSSNIVIHQGPTNISVVSGSNNNDISISTLNADSIASSFNVVGGTSLLQTSEPPTGTAPLSVVNNLMKGNQSLKSRSISPQHFFSTKGIGNHNSMNISMINSSFDHPGNISTNLMMDTSNILNNSVLGNSIAGITHGTSSSSTSAMNSGMNTGGVLSGGSSSSHNPDQQKANLMRENNSLKMELKNLRNEILRNTIKADEIQGLKINIKNLEEDKQSLKQQLLENQKKYANYENQQEIQKETDYLRKEISSLQDQIKYHQKQIDQLNEQIESLKQDDHQKSQELEQYRPIVIKVNDLEQENQRKESILKSLFSEKEMLLIKLKQESVQRQKLHNAIEDYKGRIRVFCRVRPLIQSQVERGCLSVVKINDNQSLTLDNQKTGAKIFNYDCCFEDGATQDQVFDDTKKLIQSAIDGFNVCIFAYGQTGSGKTFTMQGTKDHPGITPRTVQELFSLVEPLKQIYDVKVYCYMVEIYLDNLIDLLNTKENPQKLDIKEDGLGMTYIQHVTTLIVNSKDELQKVVQMGMINRQTGKTDMNVESSRSHLIITITIQITNRQTQVKQIGKISLVDLAGSERVNQANLSSFQIKETRAINKSLTALGDVISTLTTLPNKPEADKHVPYRNNQLTYLMKDSIGGNAKTLMFVNISPVDYNMEETQCSLFYASRVQNIINEASQNIETQEISKLKERFKMMAEENQSLQKLLQKSDLIGKQNIGAKSQVNFSFINNESSPSPHKKNGNSSQSPELQERPLAINKMNMSDSENNK